jgi:hypothetical protein
MLFGPEGAISFNNKDTIVAGTNLFKANDMMSSPKGRKSLDGGENASSVVNAIAELRRDINALANRSIIVQIDGKNVTKAIYNDPNTVGDESRTKAYQIS